MSLVIGCVVSEELWQPCQELGKDLGFEARWWGPNLRNDGDDKDHGVGGVLVQLDTDIFPTGEELPSFLSTMPLAGLPTSPKSHELARTWNIGNVIEHIEDFRSWLAEVERYRDSEPGRISGKVITVWGPHGSPGRTLLCLAIREELAKNNSKVMLIDADVNAPSIAQCLSIPQDTSGLLGALRAARVDSVTIEALLVHSVQVTRNDSAFSVLIGCQSPESLSRGTHDEFSRLLLLLRDAGWVVIVDVASRLPAATNSSNAYLASSSMTATALSHADDLVVISPTHELGVQRFCRQWPEVLNAAVSARITPVLVAPGSVSPLEIDQARVALWSFTGLDNFSVIRDLAAVEPPLKITKRAKSSARRKGHGVPEVTNLIATLQS